MDAWAVVVVAIVGLVTTAYTQSRADKRAEIERDEVRADRDQERAAREAELVDTRRTHRIATHSRFIALRQRNMLILQNAHLRGIIDPPNAEQSEDLAQARAALLLICSREVQVHVDAVWLCYGELLTDSKLTRSAFEVSYQELDGKLDELVAAARETFGVNAGGPSATE